MEERIIRVKALSGNEISVPMNETSSLRRLKEKLAEVTSRDIDDIVLLQDLTCLEDETVIKDIQGDISVIFQGRHLIVVLLSGNRSADETACRAAIAQLGVDFDNVNTDSFLFRLVFPTGESLELENQEMGKIFGIRSLEGVSLEAYFKLQNEQNQNQMSIDDNHVSLTLHDEVVAELEHSCFSVGFEEKLTIPRGTKGIVVSFDDRSGRSRTAQDAEVIWYGSNNKYWLLSHKRQCEGRGLSNYSALAPSIGG
jgi:hypothetical protein